MNAGAPFPLNPNLSCVERVRTLFREIIRRRLITAARIRPADFMTISNWIIDIQCNTLPIALINTTVLKEEWGKIDASPAVREFLFGLCFEMRMRCFEEKEDWESYLNSISQSVSQFNDQLSVIPVERLNEIGDDKKVQELLAGNAWVLPVILLEQLEPGEIGVDLAMTVMESANERADT